MDFRILGPLEVVRDGQRIELAGGRQRAVLAILLLHRGEVMSVDRIIDELWGEQVPETATKTVQVYVSRLRKALGEGILITHPGGYVIEVEPEQIDACRFERLAGQGREALLRGDAPEAAQLLERALAAWRGGALADFRYEDFAHDEADRLEELRLSAIEDRIDADLALGRHAALVPELESLTSEHPVRERLRAQQMLALYRCGRQTEALDRYRAVRRALGDEFGLEPGPELQELEHAILVQDPKLAAPKRPVSVSLSTRRARGGLLILAGGMLLLAAAVGALIAIIADGGAGEAGAPANSLALIDPDSASVTATLPTGLQPIDVASTDENVWVANAGDDTVTKVDPETRTVVATLSPAVSVAGLAAGAGGVWIGASRGADLVRLDPALGSTIDIRLAGEAAAFGPSALDPVAVGHGAVWVVNARESVSRVDPSSERVVAEVPVGNSPSAIATGAGAVWVTDDSDNTLTRIDPGSANAVTATTAVGRAPTAVAVGHDAVWVANTQDDTVARVDPESGGVLQTIPVGRRPTGIAAGRGGVWVANSLSGTVSRIDPETDRVDATVAVGSAPQEVYVDGDGVWVSVQAAADPPLAPSGDLPTDVARILIGEDPGPIDPAFFPTAVSYPTCALLYNYPDRSFPAGSRIRAEIAQGPPEISGGGRTYRFRIRSGFRFSPPSNEPVTAAAFERAIERALDPAMNSYGKHLLGEIAGAADYRAGEADRITGVDARGRELTIRLTKPVPNLTYQLAAPYFCAVPPDSPIDSEGVDGLPSAGPYYVESHEPGKSIVLRRNPNYGGSRPQNLSEIQFEIGSSPERGAEEVEAGRADYVELDRGPAPSASLDELGRRLAAAYGPGSEAARGGRQQLFEEPVPAVFSFIFNADRGPFSATRMRRAVNFAIDRRALAEVPGVAGPGRPTDQYIPPGMPGFEDAQVYPLGGPDLITARRLAGDGDRNALLYTCNTPDCTRQAEILRSNLDAIGIDLAVRQFPIGRMFAETTRRNNWDIALWGWTIDYADPFDYINNQFSAGAPRPGGFSDPEMERRMSAAAELSGSARLAAYARLDRDLTKRSAPQATFASAQKTYLVSARLGCEIYNPVYGLDFAALCIPGEGS